MEQHSTLLAALHAEETVLRQVVEVLPSLPKLGDQIARGPSTFSEATSLAQQREDERRRREAVKPPKGSKAAAVQAGVTPDAQQQPPPCPGLVVGDYQSAAPFWLFVEVSSIMLICTRCLKVDCKARHMQALQPARS